MAMYDDPQSLFAGTAATYLRYRVPHPDLFVDLVAELAPAGPILDLGCGPGPVALALADRGRPVVAIDVNADMIAAGRAEAARRPGGASVEWVCGNVHDLDAVGPAAAVTIGDAFHWFDRAELLATLDHVVAPAGFVAVIVSYAAGTRKPWWHPFTERIVDRYTGRERRAGPREMFAASAGGDHETVLRASPFSNLTVIRTDQRIRMDIDQLVGNQYTQAFSSPPVLAGQHADFDRDLRALLLAAEPTGQFQDTTQTAVIIARRAQEES